MTNNRTAALAIATAFAIGLLIPTHTTRPTLPAGTPAAATERSPIAADRDATEAHWDALAEGDPVDFAQAQRDCWDDTTCDLTAAGWVNWGAIDGHPECFALIGDTTLIACGDGYMTTS